MVCALPPFTSVFVFVSCAIASPDAHVSATVTVTIKRLMCPPANAHTKDTPSQRSPVVAHPLLVCARAREDLAVLLEQALPDLLDRQQRRLRQSQGGLPVLDLANRRHLGIGNQSDRREGTRHVLQPFGLDAYEQLLMEIRARIFLDLVVLHQRERASHFGGRAARAPQIRVAELQT